MPPEAPASIDCIIRHTHFYCRNPGTLHSRQTSPEGPKQAHPATDTQEHRKQGGKRHQKIYIYKKGRSQVISRTHDPSTEGAIEDLRDYRVSDDETITFVRTSAGLLFNFLSYLKH